MNYLRITIHIGSTRNFKLTCGHRNKPSQSSTTCHDALVLFLISRTSQVRRKVLTQAQTMLGQSISRFFCRTGSWPRIRPQQPPAPRAAPLQTSAAPALGPQPRVGTECRQQGFRQQALEKERRLLQINHQQFSLF